MERQRLLVWSSGLLEKKKNEIKKIKVYGAPGTFGWSSGLLEITLTKGAPVTLGLEFWVLEKYLERQ